MPGITVITATGGREFAFALCERWMARQTYRGDIQWILVDDCVPRTTLRIFRSVRHEQSVVCPVPTWTPGENTLARNLLAAFPHVKHDKIIFAEDDDWLAPDYLEFMAAELTSKIHLVGQSPARYFNVATHQYREFRNYHHASLGQTAIGRKMLPILRRICEQHTDFIDMRLWRQYGSEGFILTGQDVVGIKGLPGRPGIGIGHRPPVSWARDTDGSVLRDWIGEDAAVYEGYAESAAA